MQDSRSPLSPVLPALAVDLTAKVGSWRRTLVSLRKLHARQCFRLSELARVGVDVQTVEDFLRAGTYFLIRGDVNVSDADVLM